MNDKRNYVVKIYCAKKKSLNNFLDQENHPLKINSGLFII